jgi:hypothetical protein
MLFYATLCALFMGVFLIRYHVELILFVPMASGFFAYYLKLGLQDNSPVQNPERLYKDKGFLLYMTLSVMLFVLLMFVHMPVLYELFHIAPRLSHLYGRSGHTRPVKHPPEDNNT